MATWAGGWRCDVDAGGFPLVVDEPVEAGGTGAGPMPTDLLLAALSSCYALALAWAARKRGFELPDVTVHATGTYRGQTFSALLLTVTTSAPADVSRRCSTGPQGLLRLEHDRGQPAHHCRARLAAGSRPRIAVTAGWPRNVTPQTT